MTGNTSLVNYSKKLSALSDFEQKIIKYKYSGPQIKNIHETELLEKVMLLLLNINIITGWVLPTNEYLGPLINQFLKKLQENYEMLNFEEIEFAIRNSGTIIKDWGKEMNLALIDEVLVPYSFQRFELSKIEEKIKNPEPIQKIYTDEEILNIRRGEIEQAFQALKKGGMPIIHVYFHEVLKQDGFIIEGLTIDEFFVKALGTFENLYYR